MWESYVAEKTRLRDAQTFKISCLRFCMPTTRRSLPSLAPAQRKEVALTRAKQKKVGLLLGSFSVKLKSEVNPEGIIHRAILFNSNPVEKTRTLRGAGTLCVLVVSVGTMMRMLLCVYGAGREKSCGHPCVCPWSRIP